MTEPPKPLKLKQPYCNFFESKSKGSSLEMFGACNSLATQFYAPRDGSLVAPSITCLKHDLRERSTNKAAIDRNYLSLTLEEYLVWQVLSS